MASQSCLDSPPFHTLYNLYDEIWSRGKLIVGVACSSVDASIPSGIPFCMSSPSPEHENDFGCDDFIECAPSPWEVSLACGPTVRSYLDRYHTNGVVTMSSGVDTSDSSTSGKKVIAGGSKPPIAGGFEPPCILWQA